MSPSMGIMSSANCQVKTTEELTHLVDIFVLHVTRSSPGLGLSMTQMTVGVPGLRSPPTGFHQSAALRFNRQSSIFTHTPKNREKRGRLAFTDAGASGRKFTQPVTHTDADAA